MGRDKLSRRRHRVERRAIRERAVRERARARVAAAFEAWGVGRMPFELVERCASVGKRRLLPAVLPSPAFAKVVAAIEASLAEPFEEGGLSPADYYEVVLPALEGLSGRPGGAPRKSTAQALERILALIRSKHELFEAERNRRAWKVCLEHTRLDRAVFFLHTQDGEFQVEMRLPDEREFEIDGAARRVWHLVDWHEGPVFIQAHVLTRLKERLPVDAGAAQLHLLASLANPAIIERRGDGLLVEMRWGEDKIGYLGVLELSNGFLVRTFLTLGMSSTPEGRRVRKHMSNAEIRRLRLDDLRAFAAPELEALRPKLEKWGFKPMFAFAEAMQLRSA